MNQGRRKFLSYCAGLLSSVIAVALAVPLIGMFLAPVFTRRKELWLSLGSLGDVKPDEPTRFTYSYVKVDGWYETTEHGTAYVVRQGSGNLLVLSNICTHLGCGVRWDQQSDAFICPCHGGVYSRDGAVTAGPPPRPLRRLKSRVSGGQISILIEEV